MVYQRVMVSTKEHAAVQIGAPAQEPGDDVVPVAPARWPVAAGETWSSEYGAPGLRGLTLQFETPGG